MNLKKVLQFTADIAENNNREWYHANKDSYYSARDLMTSFVANILPDLSKVDESLQGLDPKETIFRIFRDVRFSANKAPYKTNIGSFIARGGRKSKFAGYYLHIEPGKSFLGGGIYMPQAPELKKIRSEIYYNVVEFNSLIKAPDFIKVFGGIVSYEDKLKTAPKGFPKDWEHIDVLRHKHFVCSHAISDKEIESENFDRYVLDKFMAMRDFNQFFNRAIMD